MFTMIREFISVHKDITGKGEKVSSAVLTRIEQDVKLARKMTEIPGQQTIVCLPPI